MYKNNDNNNQETLEEGKLANSLMLALSLTLSGLANVSCTMVNPIEAEYNYVGCYNNITDEQTITLLKRYFTKEEREYILTHLVDSSNDRSILGTTRTAIYNNGCDDEYALSEITIYDDEINEYAKKIRLPYEFTRGLTIIHELSHVLFPHDEHSSKWLNNFKPKIEEYCWDSIDTELAKYYGKKENFKTPEELVNYVIDLKISQYL